ncbi:MAG: hypothetical protein RMY16_30090 [Nostoc sp. DedQUE12b]|uniref:hypothetical protein n=1 Tax=Nostoc sp. DedQUE12b TaxID=3075398 RepID=UPI002AD55364|nr:hypothetical protein [Nostoc sp. DedQUE12b]MDZ8089772.1 hypothetical protein [Nostoc sp. DedQUE12b]
MAEPLSTIATGVVVAFGTAATAAGQKVGEYGAEKAIEAWEEGWERHDEAVGAMFCSSNYELEEAEG